MNIQRKTLSIAISLIFLGTSSFSSAQSKDLATDLQSLPYPPSPAAQVT